MSWATDVYSAVRKIILLEDRVESLTDEVRKLTASQIELDRRLIRLEAKFELLERMAAPSRRALPEKSET
jgi:predicted  nucleic acid-binding Zn-ribbon protein